ncbi:MAG TPA: outer membrane lipoprotein-sorting protein [Bacteroidia bacterium]|jgi:outer membrane lipoprotein-sorting protein|nr:outer membrane lipoprotein-sorting protein [Bacteroidia bacterium]
MRQSTLTAKEIIEKAENRVRGKTSVSEVEIQIVRPTWTRTMKTKAWTQGDSLSMILITAPAKDNGTVFLKRNKEVWNWIPSIERVIKLPPSMMTQSWMGTDFTNDDLVKESSMADDYTQVIDGDSVIDGHKCWKIELTPLASAAVIWGKVNLWIDQDDFLELRAEFIDEDNNLVNVMKASDIRLLGGILLPAKMEMIPVTKPGQKTVLTYSTLTFNQPIAADFFTVENIKNVK